jgi:demethylmenaquinone methyltransferase/2-methoxy-6-polyprenyl-1,4-benzoquinol methylase
MGKSFFDPGQQRGPKVNALFDKIARRYDLINDLQSFGLHRYWKRRLIQLGNLKSGTKALDICCGTADLALAMARAGAEVVGLDFSEQMLRVAESRAEAQANLTKSRPRMSNTETRGAVTPTFIRGDAQRIPFPDDSFEIVTVGYGLRNLASWEAGLEEMLRVTRAGGRLLVIDFGKPENVLWRSAYYAYLRSIVPVLGRVFAGSWSAYAYILESLKHYPAQQGVARKMRELGMSNVRVIDLVGGVMSINCGEKPNGQGNL